MKEFFGTDGIRGKVGQPPITPEWLLRCGYAAGKVLAQKHRKIIIGKDTRVSGYLIESALQAGLIAAGCDVVLLGPLPTPAVSYLTPRLKADAGIVVSASHNPYDDNGVKFFNAQGDKLSDPLEVALEEKINQSLTIKPSQTLGKKLLANNAVELYLNHLKNAASLDLSHKKIVIDNANGATYKIAPALFESFGATVIPIANTPNGYNINDQCGSTYPENCQRQVLAEKADIGITFDGDGDRVLLIDKNGELLDGDSILYILAHYYQAKGWLKGPVVGTIMSNMGLEIALSAKKIPFLRVPVGDRHVLAALKEHQGIIGGEPSGHLLTLSHANSGDGILTAILTLAALLDKSIKANSFPSFSRFHQTLLNVRYEGERRNNIQANPAIHQAQHAVEAALGSKGRVVLRPSGTEPVIRIMVEGENEQEVTQHANQLAKTVKSFF